MRVERFLPWLLAAVVFLVMVLVYVQFLALSGFPDGYRTDFARGQGRLLSVFLVASLAIDVYCLTLGWSPSEEASKRKLAGTTLVYGILLAATFLINQVLWQYLDHGGGG